METNKPKRLRVMVCTNAIYCPSGYANQARQFVPMIRDEGYPIAMINFYGQEGGIFELDGILMYPRMADQWGADAMVEHSKDFKADVVISLQDSWVLDINALKAMGTNHVRYVPLVPIDHEPIPPAVKDRMDQAFRIISMSPFGEREMKRVGLHSTYIPHTVDCQLFKKLEDKSVYKKMLGIPEDHFLFGMISANKDNPPRKGFQHAMDAFKVFHDKYPKSSMYFHTQPRQNGGFQLEEYAKVLGYGKDVFFPLPYNLLYKIQPDDMVKIFNAFDCLLMPSTNEGFGIPCYTFNSKVWNGDNVKDIGDIRIGDEVVSHTGEIKKVTETFRRSVKDEPMVDILFMGARNALNVTQNHPVLSVKRGGRRTDDVNDEPIWNSVGDLNVGDYVVVPRVETDNSLKEYDFAEEFQDGSLTSKYSNQSTNKFINSKIELDEDLGFFIGQYISNGSTGQNYQIEFCNNSKKLEVNDRIVRVIKEKFGVEPRIYDKTTYKRIVFTNKRLGVELKRLCGIGSRNKKLPYFWRRNDSFRKGLLQGLLSGDGSVGFNITYNSTSETLLEGMRQLLTTFGIYATMAISKRDGANSLCINGKQTKILMNLKDRVWRQRFVVREDYFLVPITKIRKYKYTGEVFNLEVDEDHSYCVSGLSSHNCIEAGACEVPVIATDFTSMRDLVINGETGYKIQVGEKRFTLLGSYIGIPDQEDLTRLMFKMYEDTDRVVMGQKARKFVLDNFDQPVVFNNCWKPFLERLEHEIYDLKF